MKVERVTRYITYDRRHFIDYEKQTGTVTLADGKTIKVKGKGMVRVPIQGKITPIADVIYVPGIGFNLLSVGQLTSRGMTCEFVGDMAILSRRGEIMATATRKGTTYALIAGPPNDIVRIAQTLDQTEL